MIIACRAGALVLALGLCTSVAHDAGAKPVTPAATPPSIDVGPDGLHADITWDPRIENLLGWAIASPKISTACRTGRSAFPSKVAQVDCGVDFSIGEMRRYRGRVAFANLDGGDDRGRAISTTLASDAEVSAVPLPGAAVLFGTALIAGAWLRRRR